MNSVQAGPASLTPQPGITTVLLIRHAATAPMHERLMGRLPGVSLTDEGKQQAGDLATALAAVPLAAIYCSPLTRARETAAPLAATLHVPVAIDDELIEVDFGEWTGLTFAELSARADWQTYNASRGAAQVPRGESPAAASARIARALAALRARHPGGMIAAITHAELVRYAVLHARHLPLDRWAEIDIAPASVTRLQFPRES